MKWALDPGQLEEAEYDAAPASDIVVGAPTKLPAVDDYGAVFKHIGGHYMQIVGVSLMQMGAEENMTPQEYFNRWRHQNQTPFFTQLASKFIPKHVEVTGEITVEGLLEQLDASDRAVPIEGHSRVIEDGT